MLLCIKEFCMRVTSKCNVCNELTDEKECPQCDSLDLFVVYECSHCKKTWYSRNHERTCCEKAKKEKKERNNR